MGTKASEGSSTLFLDAEPGDDGPEACHQQFETDCEHTELLAVTMTRSPSEWTDAYQKYVGPVPDELSIVAVGETTRSASAGTSPKGLLKRHRPTVTAIEEPGDLTGLAMRMDDRFEEWRQSAAEDTHRAVCFGSLTTLLQFVDLETAFRFLHVMTRQVAQVGAVAHFHIAPDAHDEQTLATIKSLFDFVVEAGASEDGGQGSA